MSISLPIPIPLSFALRIDGARAALHRRRHDDRRARRRSGAGAARRRGRIWSNELKSDVAADAAPAAAAGRCATGSSSTQIAVTMVLLVAAGLLTRSLIAAQHVDIGFRTGGLAVALDRDEHARLRRRAREGSSTIARSSGVRAMPGVESAALAERLPFSINYNRNNDLPARSAWARRQGPRASTSRASSPEYFATLGVPIVQGRNFAPTDTPTSPRRRHRQRGDGAQVLAESERRSASASASRTLRRPRGGDRRRRRPTTRSAPSARRRRRTSTTPCRSARARGETIVARTRGDAGALLRGDAPRAARRSSRTSSSSTTRRWRRRWRRRCCRRKAGAISVSAVGVVAMAAGVDRPLRRDRLLGRAAHARDRHPHGARRAGRRRSSAW